MPGTFPDAKLVHNFFCDVLLRIVEGTGGGGGGGKTLSFQFTVTTQFYSTLKIRVAHRARRMHEHVQTRVCTQNISVQIMRVLSQQTC